MGEENKNKNHGKNTKVVGSDENLLERLVLRSPLLRIEQKTKLLSEIGEKSPEEIGRLIRILRESEENFFKNLKAAGLSMDEYQVRLKHYFQGKIEKLEKEQHSKELVNVEDLLNES